MRTHDAGAVRAAASYLTGISLMATLVLFAHSALSAQGSAFQLQSVKGRVSIQARGQGAWVPVRRSTQMAAVGDRIRTGPDGSAYIVTGAGQRVALGANTEVILREPQKPSGWRVVVGRVWAILGGGQKLEVRAPGAIAAAEGTTFQVDVAEDGTTMLTVVEGVVDFYNDLGAVKVVASQQSTARPGSAPTRPAVVDPSGTVAWEASLQTLLIDPEYPQVGTDPQALEAELTRRRQALEQRPGDAAAQAAVTEVLLDLGRTEEAEAQAQGALEAAPQDALLKGLLGFALLRAGRPTEAGDAFAAAAEAQPEEARWQVGQALIALAQRDSRPAVAALQRAAQLAPASPVPQAYLAAAYLRAGDLTQAGAAAAEALRLGPDSHLANAYLAYVRLAEGNLEEAIAAGSKATAAAPQSALAHEVLGASYFFAGRFGEARPELRQAVELNPFSSSGHLTMAKLLAAEDQLPPALQQAQQAICLDPQSAPAHTTLGLLFLLNNDSQRAGREFRKALTLDAGLAEAHTGWGMVLAKRGALKEALDQQKSALSLDTDSASAENNLGGVYASMGRMTEAVDHLNRAIELQPKWGMPYANLAVVHLEQNEFREALDAGEKAVELGERSAFIHTVLARVYLRQGRRDRALAELRQAVALDETYPQAHFQLSRLYLQQDRSRDSLREILTALTYDPSAMVDTRQYARTDVVASGGSYDTTHLDARHSDMTADGKLSYLATGSADASDGWRDNQDSREGFVEVFGGYQPSDTQQFVLWGTLFSRQAGLPGPTAAALPADFDDEQSFNAYSGVLAYRQRLADGVSATAKYSFHRTNVDFHNPDSLGLLDDNAFRRLDNTVAEQGPEIRLDAELDPTYSVHGGYSHSWVRTGMRGVVGTVEPGTASATFAPFAEREANHVETAWIEGRARLSNRFHLTVGGQMGRQPGSDTVLLPKVVALYRPDKATWVAAMANPIFRNDAAELAPVEALADPAGLRYLNFVEGGAGRVYELRFQRQAGRDKTITGALAYQRVRGLLVDVQDPLWTGLPMRVLVDRGQRWVADVAYEQWLTDALTGRVWARWQDSDGIFSALGASGAEWPYTPHWQAGGRLDYIDASGVRLGLEGVWVGSRFNDAANAERVDGFPLINLRAEYQQNLHLDYFIAVNNLTGEDYQTFSGFPQAGTTVFAGVEYRP